MVQGADALRIKRKGLSGGKGGKIKEPLQHSLDKRIGAGRSTSPAEKALGQDSDNKEF